MNISETLAHFELFYNLDECLGKGRLSHIYKISTKDGKHTYALKLFPVENVSSSSLENIKTEGHLTKNINFQNVISYYGSYKVELKNQQFYGILMEYFNGRPLLDILSPLSDSLILEMMRQSASGLSELHSSGIVHRDIKPENLLWNGKKIKIIDLEFAGMESGIFSCRGRKGTPYYLSPEIFLTTSVSIPFNILKSSDVWALGVTFYHLIHKIPPFGGNSFDELRSNVISRNFLSPIFSPTYPRSCLIIEACFEPKESRPSAQDLVKIISGLLNSSL